MAEGWTVYVVDDDSAVRDSIRLLLEANGYAVRIYASAAQFRDNPPPYRNSCLMIDAGMPGGIELLKQLRLDGIVMSAIALIDGLTPRMDADACGCSRACSGFDCAFGRLDTSGIVILRLANEIPCLPE